MAIKIITNSFLDNVLEFYKFVKKQESAYLAIDQNIKIMQEKFYELTDSQWQIIEKIIDSKRKRRHSLRTMINAIFYVNYTGIQWRNLESKYPPWQSVFYHFTQFKRRGIWEQILDCLVLFSRRSMGREDSPSLLAIDSQLVKTVQFVAEGTGVDGHKNINGRKRTILVDKLGHPFAIKVTGANISDNEAGLLALELLQGKVARLEKIAADKGYKNTFIEQTHLRYGWEVEIAQKPESAKGFVPEKNRWQVERSFSWLNFRRRLFREIEKTIESAEAMLQIAFISFYIRKL